MAGPLSLRARLGLAGVLGVALSALLAGWLLGLAFARSGQQVLDSRLDDDFATLAGLIEATGDGGWQLTRPPADDRFVRIFSGWYWVVGDGPRRMQSRSLWDGDLGVLEIPAVGEADWAQIEGPRGQTLRLRSQLLRLPGVDAPLPVWVAGDLSVIVSETREFRLIATLAFAGFAAIVLLLLLWQMTWGLRPLARMRTTLGRVRSGDDARFGEDRWPAEVAPLARQIDDLLDEHDRRVERARHAAQDLAHELKTPLSVLSAEAERPGPEIAGVVRDQVQRMRHAIERRLAGSLGADRRKRIEVAPVLSSLVLLFRNMSPDSGIHVDQQVEAGSMFAGSQEDLEEMLGNLIDNAIKWARARVVIRVERSAAGIRVRVQDDGPGIPDDTIDAVLQRGVRLDERKPGSGFGLAIVDEIAASHDGRLSLHNIAGGFVAELELPSGARPA